MMRGGWPILLAAVVASGCTAEISLSTKTRDVQDNVLKSDSLDWSGGKIRIQSDGVSISLNGGVKVIADPNAKRVSAEARFVAMVLPEEKANGDRSINDAVNTFSVTRSGDDVTVSCIHGGTHGSSSSGDSGCELLTVTIPTGSLTSRVDLGVFSGNGEVSLSLSSAVLATLETSADVGDIVAQLPSTQGASLALVGERANDIDVTMAPGWSSDAVVLTADADGVEDHFPLTAAGGYGTPGAGLASLKITSKPFAGATGTITLH